MKVVEPKVELIAYSQLPPTVAPWTGETLTTTKLVPTDSASELARIVERAGRVSWKSEDKIAPGSADGFMTRVVNIRKDFSIAEHASVTLLFTTDRYVSHQLVRHRIAAYTQESTHYINYGKKGDEIEVCEPLGIAKHTPESNEFIQFPTVEYVLWRNAMRQCEQAYFELLRLGVKHYHARYVLPGCLKTEVVATYNLRMWLHVFKERCTPNNTPEITLVMKQALAILNGLCPEMFAETAKAFLG